MRAERAFGLVALTLALGGGQLSAQAITRARLEAALDPRIQEAMRTEHIPGLAVGIVHAGRLVYAKGFGVTRPNGPAISPSTLFHIASMTKPFVATSVVQLANAGKVDLDAPVTRYLPYFRMADERARTITVRQMLTHTSGMPDVSDYRWDHPENDAAALERYVRSLDTLRLLHDPGQGFRYSNMAYEVLGALVARVSGDSFEDYVEHHILAPLRMNGSTFFPDRAAPALLARPHTRDSAGATVPVRFFPYNRAHSPSSNLLSSIEDLSHWAAANLNRGELAGRRILPATSYDVMWHPYASSAARFVPDDTTAAAIGISWFLHPYRGHRLVYHGGGDDGFRSMIILVPDTQDAVIVLTNFDAGWPATRPIAWAAMDLLLPDR